MLSNTHFRKIIASVIFPHAILGPEMAAPILWAPGIFCSFCWKTPMPVKFCVLGVGRVLGFSGRGGWSANLIFMGAGIFLTIALRGDGAAYLKINKARAKSMIRLSRASMLSNQLPHDGHALPSGPKNRIRKSLGFQSQNANRNSYRTLSFLSLFIFSPGKRHGNHKKTRIMEKKGKTPPPPQKEIPHKGEKQGIPKKQGKEGRSRFRRKIAENSRNEIANRCVSKSQIPNRKSLAFKTARTSQRSLNLLK